jgi:hypothetical protein
MYKNNTVGLLNPLTINYQPGSEEEKLMEHENFR